MLNHRYLYLTGLPCSGIFFVSQLLAQHPEIDSDYLRSPVCDLLLNFRNFLTTNPELINGLNQDFNGTMERSLIPQFIKFGDSKKISVFQKSNIVEL